MLTGGHIAASYLIAQAARNIGVPLTNTDIVMVIAAGNIPDLDFLTGLFNKRTGELHHQNISHTPLGSVLFTILLTFLFKLDTPIMLFVFLSLIIHLILDDLGHILAKLKLFSKTPNPQINWLYPFTLYSKHKPITGNKEALKTYLVNGWPVAGLELLLVLLGLIMIIHGK